MTKPLHQGKLTREELFLKLQPSFELKTRFEKQQPSPYFSSPFRSALLCFCSHRDDIEPDPGTKGEDKPARLQQTTGRHDNTTNVRIDYISHIVRLRRTSKENTVTYVRIYPPPRAGASQNPTPLK